MLFCLSFHQFHSATRRRFRLVGLKRSAKRRIFKKEFVYLWAGFEPMHCCRKYPYSLFAFSLSGLKLAGAFKGWSSALLAARALFEQVSSSRTGVRISI
jgi:hypothetical protein